MAHEIASYGFCIVPRAEFEALESLDGYGGKNDDLDRANAAALKDRAARWPGAFVLYDPAADDEGLLLCGDDPAELSREALTFID